MEKKIAKGQSRLNREKRYYQLCIEYLRQSEDYRDFCAWVVIKRENHTLPVPDKFKNDPITGSAPKELFNYLIFGNIHDPVFSFDEWFDRHKEKARYREKHSSPQPIEDFLEHLEGYMDTAIQSFKRHHKDKQPTLLEFKNHFPQWLRGIYGNHFLFLSVNPNYPTSPKNIVEQFDKLLTEKKKKRFKHGFRYSIPDVRGIKFDALERYLAVYIKREKEKMKWKDIIGTISPKLNYENVRRAYLMDFRNAKRLVRSVEFGIFPGKYEICEK